jgi:hypothetical protein
MESEGSSADIPADERRVRDVVDRVLRVERSPSVQPWLAALLSLGVPGLGQVYLGQHLKGVVLFSVSALLCFGGGLCNVVAALDAWSLAGSLRERDIERLESSVWLRFATGVVKLVYRGTRAFFSWLNQYNPLNMGPLGRPLRLDGRIRLPAVEPAHGSEEALGWLEDGRVEHASAATFARLSLELLSLGAPSALVGEAHHAALDELRHARICFAVAGRLLGREIRPGPLDCLGGPARTTHATVALEALVDGCLGEGFGAAVAEHRARSTADPELAELLAGIAADERRHAELGWSVLQWAIEAGGPAVLVAVLGQLGTLPTVGPPGPEAAAMWTAIRRDVVTRAARLGPARNHQGTKARRHQGVSAAAAPESAPRSG